jgi:hypothetical protein
MIPVGLAMAADLLTFALVVPLVGIGAEVNPIMARAYMQFGLAMVIVLKAVCTAALLLLVARTRRRLPVVLGMGMGLLGTAGNVTAWALR